MKNQQQEEQIEERPIPPERLLNRATLLYGASGSGKSVVITEMLHDLKPYIDQVIVFAPTDRQNETYSKGVVPLPFIHYEVTGEILTTIWDRQEALTTVWKQANDAKILERLYAMAPEKQKERQGLEAMAKQLRTHKQKLQNSALSAAEIKAIMDKMDSQYNELRTKIMKMCITRNNNALTKLCTPANNYEREIKALKYHDMNPRLIMIFDDCTDLIKKYKGHPVVQKIFYQGRHASITAIIALHTDKSIDSELKKSAAIELFTEPRSARAYIGRSTTGFDKNDKERAFKACDEALEDRDHPYQKLYWDRLAAKWFKFTATPRAGFSFGGDQVVRYAEEISADQGQVSASNAFISKFT